MLGVVVTSALDMLYHPVNSSHAFLHAPKLVSNALLSLVLVSAAHHFFLSLHTPGQEEWKAWTLPAVRLQRQNHQDVGRQHWHVPYDTGEDCAITCSFLPFSMTWRC